jgi:hypothetical protein
MYLTEIAFHFSLKRSLGTGFLPDNYLTSSAADTDRSTFWSSCTGFQFSLWTLQQDAIIIRSEIVTHGQTDISKTYFYNFSFTNAPKCGGRFMNSIQRGVTKSNYQDINLYWFWLGFCDDVLRASDDVNLRESIFFGTVHPNGNSWTLLASRMANFITQKLSIIEFTICTSCNLTG